MNEELNSFSEVNVACVLIQKQAKVKQGNKELEVYRQLRIEIQIFSFHWMMKNIRLF